MGVGGDCARGCVCVVCVCVVCVCWGVDHLWQGEKRGERQPTLSLLIAAINILH